MREMETNTTMNNGNEVSLTDIRVIIKSWVSYLLSKWVLIITIAFIFGVFGVVYASLQKPMYTAQITFAPENDRSSAMSSYAGLAAQFGITGVGGGGVFEGDNLIEFLRSKMLIKKALLSQINWPTDKTGTNNLLINYYIRAHQIDKEWARDSALRNLSFSPNDQLVSRTRDSILNEITSEVDKNLQVDKVNKWVNIIGAKIKDEDELFCKLFIEQLVKNGVQYYVDYRSKKTRENVEILQRQTDSVRSTLTGNIVSAAQSTDLNINPIRQIVRTNVQRKQVDVQTNSALYTELVKNLELSKIALRKETPLVVIIDTPVLPLEKNKLSRTLTGVLFAIAGGILSIIYVIIKRWWKEFK
jgi:hypothetical protein